MKPDWLKIKIKTGSDYKIIESLIKESSLNTICSSGKCPNRNECWSRGAATFMILGDICSRGCKFCATDCGVPNPPDILEPDKIAQSIKKLNLSYCVITSVTRDDLPDEGANHWSQVITCSKRINPNTIIEVLIPDFNNKKELIDIILSAKPHVISHNIETVSRITPLVRSKATYQRSLEVIKYISSNNILTKSGLMVGLGESFDEVITSLKDLYANGCKMVTIGQYLQPSQSQVRVEEYISPQTFELIKKAAFEIGFIHCESGPFVRSSYMAENSMSVVKNYLIKNYNFSSND